MKKGLLSTLMIAAIGFTAEAQVPKTPLIEHFTQASCGPCASQNPALKTTLDNFGTANYVKVTHQTSWPGVDPMNANYPAGPNDRRVYYGVSAVPRASLNGGANAAPNTAVTTSTLNAAAAQTTPYDMDITQTWLSGTSVRVDVVVRNSTAAAVSTADKLYVAMTENYISYATAPGSNGETEFYYVMREMYNASTGASTTAGLTIGAIPANDSLTYSFTLTSIPNYIRDLNQVAFAAYLQTQSSKVIHQSAKSQAGSVPGLLDVASQSNSTVGTGYCNTSFDPVINFTNNGPDPVTSVTAEYSINGGTPVSQTFTGNLTQGQSTTITFANTNLASGTSTVSYAITDVNNGGTYSPGNVAMGDDVYNKLKLTGTTGPVTEGFETAPLISGTGYSRTLNTAIFDAPDLAPNLFSILNGPSYNYGAIGGFAQSNRSIRFRAYSISPAGTVGSVVMEKVNLQNSSKVVYSYSHQQYTGANERLDVEVSTDCGATWTIAATRAGAQLATITPSATTQFNYPTAAAQWATDTVDISAFDNNNDVVVRFKLTSGYGNNVFIDDLNILTSTATNVAAVENTVVEMNIMPNPVRDYMTVAFTMEEMTDATISIVNALGQRVQQVASQSFEGVNNLEVNTSQLTTGVYFLNITSEKGTSTKRFVVEK